MNHRLSLAILLLGISSLAAATDEEQVKACDLLQAENLAPWGYAPRLNRENWSLTFEQAKLNAPSDVHSDTCTLRSEDAAHHGATVLVVESFASDTPAAAISSWIKDIAARPKEADEKVQEVKIGDAMCEIGEYPMPAAASAEATTQHYVACDQLVGTRHLTVNVQQSDATQLPTPPQVKDLLDQAAKRLAAI